MPRLQSSPGGPKAQILNPPPLIRDPVRTNLNPVFTEASFQPTATAAVLALCPSLTISNLARCNRMFLRY
jgi:hypothetical protein